MSHRPSTQLLRAAVFLLVAVSALVKAEPAPSYRRPVGVYAHVSIEGAIQSYQGTGTPTPHQLRAYLRDIYKRVLANPAISGIEAGRHWDNIQLADPLCTGTRSCPADAEDGYDWTYLDDLFAEANAAHKTVQLIITPGVSSPSWLLDRIPTCDGLFTGAGAPQDCGWATFDNFPESQRADSHRQPMPWNAVYATAWNAFLVHLEARFGSNPAFVAIAVAGPNTASDEFILPTTNNQSIQPSGDPPVAADKAWQTLIANAFPLVPRYQDTDEAIVDAWERTIDAYELIFSHVTLILGPDAGNDWPNPPGPVQTPTDQWLYTTECSANASNAMSCAAKTEVIQYFLDASGPNGKATQVGGLTAGSRIATGDIGIASVKVLTGLTPSPLPPIQGGAEFDHSVSGGSTIYQQDCPDYTPSNQKPADCQPTAEEGAAATFKVFFSGTPVGGDFGAMSGSAPVQYIGIDYEDVDFATTEPCPRPSPSLEDLLGLASRDLFEMAGRPLPPLPPSCTATGMGM